MVGDRELADAESADEAEDAPSVEVPWEFRHLEERERVQGLSLRKLYAEQEHGLRRKYADWIIWMLGAQFLVADAVFVVFAWAGRRWDLPAGVVEVWAGRDGRSGGRCRRDRHSAFVPEPRRE